MFKLVLAAAAVAGGGTLFAMNSGSTSCTSHACSSDSAPATSADDELKMEYVATEAVSKQQTARGFQIHSTESAPAETKEILNWYVEHFEFVPNLAGVMAESPELLGNYWSLTTSLQAGGELTPPEDNIVQLAIAVENQCQYCVAGGTMAGKIYFKSTEEQLQALRTSSKLSDAKFEALRSFAVEVYKSRGRVSDSTLQTFFDAGYSRQAALEVVANVSAKVMTNFTNQMTLNPMDDMLTPFAEGLPFKEDRPVVKK